MNPESCIIGKYSEIALKGLKRRYFEKKLVDNIKDCLDKNNAKYQDVKAVWSRIIIFGDLIAAQYIKNVFGLASISKAMIVNLDMDAIKKSAYYLTKDLDKNNSFKINANRANKKFPISSLELNKEIGSFIQDKTKAKVNLKNPSLTIYVEILDKAYLYTEKIQCYGGLPISTQGRVLCIIDDEKSLLACWLAMKRGCSAFILCNKNADLESIKKFIYGFKLKFRVADSIEKEDINKTVKENNCKAVVVGQILEDFKKIEVDVPVLRPLIAFSEKDIDNKLQQIKKD